MGICKERRNNHSFIIRIFFSAFMNSLILCHRLCAILGPRTRRVSDTKMSIKTTSRFRGSLKNKKNIFFVWDDLMFKKYKYLVLYEFESRK